MLRVTDWLKARGKKRSHDPSPKSIFWNQNLAAVALTRQEINFVAD
ncbi:hypothetical protein HC931_02460 [Candidatus Gracilibacteria bacterium]|nr:hypothetical protein [Candidatus Gracilibacteria bacterium]NJP21521.1 hypothetical protein [Hydrococcus sp. CRU_1_1]